MKELHCPKCKNTFYTAARQSLMPCPYCGFSSDHDKKERREYLRTPAVKPCDITRGEVKVEAKSVDVADGGVGVRMLGYLPFDREDHLTVEVHGGQSRQARIIWIKRFYGISRAGLMFI